jgi:hypothetical protein
MQWALSYEHAIEGLRLLELVEIYLTTNARALCHSSVLIRRLIEPLVELFIPNLMSLMPIETDHQAVMALSQNGIHIPEPSRDINDDSHIQLNQHRTTPNDHFTPLKN